MYRVPQYLGFALHALLLPSLRPLIAAPFSIACTILLY
jgi:hypothetical protein